jgi:methionyl-tRNA formyltransferase
MAENLRVIFMGTPEFSVPALKAIRAGGHDIVCVYSQPPRPKGRGQHISESPVHAAALELALPVRTPLNFMRDEDIAAFMALEADVAVVAAYGLILPQIILDSPRHGCINIHASLLPRWRGAAPIQRAIMEGDSETGITIMQMEAGLDTGPMIAKKSVPIRPATTTQSLHDILSILGASMIRDVLATLSRDGALAAEAQAPDGFTYAKMLKKEEGAIDWSKPAIVLDRQIRALNPWPGTWCTDEKMRRLKIIEAIPMPFRPDEAPGTILDNDGIIACGDNTALKLEVVQPENKKPMPLADAMRGGYIAPGQKLS